MSTTDQSTPNPTDTQGSFAGVDVYAGTGGGLVSHPPAVGTVTHYHAAQLPELGDVVLAVARSFDPATGAAVRIVLRAFAASAAGRGALAQLPVEQFNQAPGAIAFAELALANAGDAADERRPAELVRCSVSDAAPTAEAARGVADWLRSAWETELSFGSWPAVRGTLDAFADSPGDFSADWAADWLRASEHHVGSEADPRFLKVLDAAWLDTLPQ
jgi:hypothetical protein